MLNQPNKIFSRFVLFLGIILTLTACDGRPKGVLSKSEMISVLTDLHKLDGYLFEKGYQYNHFVDKTPYYHFILQKHGITESEFDASLVWYTKNPKTFERIYDQVLVNLTEFDNIVKSGKYHPVDSAALAKMKINIWNKSIKYQFTKDSIRTRLHFEITDNNLMLGDVYVLRFLQQIAPEDSCTNQHVVLRINYTDGKTDSAFAESHNDNLSRRYTFRLPALRKQKIKSVSGELLGSKEYKGKFNAMLDSISLTREFNGLKQDSLRKVLQKADSNYNVSKLKLKSDSLLKTTLFKNKPDSVLIKLLKPESDSLNMPSWFMKKLVLTNNIKPLKLKTDSIIEAILGNKRK